MFKLFCGAIETVFDFLECRVVGNGPGKMKPCLEIAFCKPVKLAYNAVKRFCGYFSCEGRDKYSYYYDSPVKS